MYKKPLREFLYTSSIEEELTFLSESHALLEEERFLVETDINSISESQL